MGFSRPCCHVFMQGWWLQVLPRLSPLSSLSVRDGQPAWAKSGFTVTSAHKGTSYFSHALTILKPDFLFPSSRRGPDWKLPGNSHRFNFLIFLPLQPSPSPFHSHPKRKESTSSAEHFHSLGQGGRTSEFSGPLLWGLFGAWGEHLRVICDPVQKQRNGTL